ncbi:hypothetical protein BCR36DRAFT_362353 [Piromyces finnis]|uniref:Uncharacterized protein n=1 Tax=Piromyces finnis TaxID=1754191 RepID=A0A1Y1UYB3_9FUNG|nr:hypothetical protein BCR36DRAFT_362353 [Piromyces finnis]|eukprot:ORX42565.1 hypothetical protein BCR36DRAFT_362353 [Piromyces finnis]
MLTLEQIQAIEQSERQYFIESNRDQATYFQWLRSKGTNFTCYIQYLNSLSEEDVINNKIESIRIAIYAISKIFTFNFFYWTLLIFIIHRFSFKKPVMKIILLHFLIRGSGDVIDKLGEYFKHYYSNTPITDENGNVSYICQNNVYFTEMHPFRWFFTRQIGTVCWYFGEMIADWYPLIRTKAVTKDRSIWYVYLSCALFNLAKLSLILFHFTLKPEKLYDVNGVFDGQVVNNFYNTYWVIQISIIYTSLIYDFTVFFVLKRKLNEMGQSEFGFLKRFRNVSEFRILISIIISIVFLPICSVSIILKFYYRNKKGYQNLEFSFEDIRTMIANVQYYMIFIDQILLLHLKNESSINATTTPSCNKSCNNFNLSSISNQFNKNINGSKLYYEKLSNLNLNKEAEESKSNLLENRYSGDTSITINANNLRFTAMGLNDPSFLSNRSKGSNSNEDEYTNVTFNFSNINSYSNNFSNRNQRLPNCIERAELPPIEDNY